MEDKDKKAIGIGLGVLALLGLGIGLSKIKGGGSHSNCTATQYWNGSACEDRPSGTDPLVCASGYHPNAGNTACEIDTTVKNNNSESGLPICMKIQLVDNAYGTISEGQIDVRGTMAGWVSPSPVTKSEWNFGDGTIVDAMTNPSGLLHTYSSLGTYVIKATIELADGNKGAISREITLSQSKISATTGWIGNGGFTNVERYNPITKEYESVEAVAGFRYKSMQLTGARVIGLWEASEPNPAWLNSAVTIEQMLAVMEPFLPYSVQIDTFVPFNESTEGWCAPSGIPSCQPGEVGMYRTGYGGAYYIASNAHKLLGEAYPELIWHYKSPDVYGKEGLLNCMASNGLCPLYQISFSIERMHYQDTLYEKDVIWQEI